MPGEFYLDTDGSAQDPANAIAILRSNRSTTDLSSLADGNGYVVLAGNQALLMMGTTEELLDAVGQAAEGGVKHIAPGADGDSVVWYVRRKAGGLETPLGTVGGETKTVACIASLELYWGLRQNDPSQIAGQWYPLSDQTYTYGIDLDTLRSVVRRGRGVDPWY
jgi:hypothetical protein